MASGTAPALEGLLVGKPMVVGYQTGKVTCRTSRLVSEFVSLPNLLCREQLVPELIQDGLTTDAIVESVNHWFDHPDQARPQVPFPGGP